MKTSTIRRLNQILWGAVAIATMALLVLVLGRPAEAAPGDSVWIAKHDSTIVNQDSVILNGGNTSVEASSLGVEVEAGTVVTFYYGLDAGAKCTAGAPRVFMQVGEVYHNSWDQNIGAGTQCGTEGKVTFTLPEAGTIRQAGVVYDNGQAGTVIVSNLSIGEVAVNFEEKTPLPTSQPPTSTPTSEPTGEPTSTPTSGPTSTPTTEPTGEPTGTPTGTPTSVPTTTVPTEEPPSTTEPPTADPIPVGNNTDGGSLALTGTAFIPGLALFGVVLVGGGGLVFFLARKRREATEEI